MNDNHTLESEAEGTPSKGEKYPKDVKATLWPTSLFKINNLKIALLILMGLFILIILFLVLGFKEGSKCLENPFIYGANKITTRETGEIRCTCNFLENQKYAPFYFNTEEVKVLVREGIAADSPSQLNFTMEE